MSKILVVARKELQSYLRDRADLAFSLLLPVAIFALMYGAFSGESFFNGTAYIVDEDRGEYSAMLIERLEEHESLEVSLLSDSEASLRLQRSDVLLVAYIPEDFSEKIADMDSTMIMFKQRGNAGQEGQIVASIIRGTADRISQEIQVEYQVQRAMLGTPVGAEHVSETVQKLLEREKELPLIAVTENVIGEDVNLVDQFLPGIVTMFVLFTITLGSRAIVEERKMGTLERLMTTRLTIGQLFMGKFLSGTIRGFVQTLILLVLSYIIFQMFTPLSFITVLLVALIFSAAASTIGLIIASVARTEDQAVWISVFVTMATVMMGGTFFEIPADSPLYFMSRISLNTYANDAFKTLITRGGILGDVIPELIILVAVIAAGFIISRVFFKVMPEGR